MVVNMANTINAIYKTTLLLILAAIAIALYRIDVQLVDYRPQQHYIDHNYYDVIVEPGAGITIKDTAKK